MPGSAKVRMVKGPAEVAVDGICHVLGSDVSGQVIAVRPGKALPFEPSGQCRLHLRFGRGGRMWLANPAGAGTTMWYDIARQVSVLADKKITVMLAGDTDTGKSTFSAYLANVALSRRVVPCVIDGDIGQGDLVPPASIGAAALSGPVTDLRDASASLFEFVGHISPAGYEYLVAKKLRSILERAAKLGDFSIVNTDGYVRDACAYKLMIAKELQPDVIVCFGENPTLFKALRDGPWQVLCARASSYVSKSRFERTRRRLDQFHRYIGRGSFTAKLRQLKFVYGEMVFSPLELRQPPIKQLERKNLKKMFVGLGSGDRVEGFGIVTDITTSIIRIQTDIAHFDRVYLSNIQLDRAEVVEIRL